MRFFSRHSGFALIKNKGGEDHQTLAISVLMTGSIP